ncbi:glycohydrolase toxin TNT-related protein [Clostridium sp. KNHs205]|uniref:glycohydrolase toxin TNT-related protein n=1 Tax=Clostridium sp. KNHs205 TaxID=1449050 RepID=UPI00068A91D4|nr:glycohydrolase toxin TNT-related protein [Clostridium sp. KNHs205]
MILDLFAKDYENLVNNDKIDPSKVNLQEYLDSLVLKEFAHKKDAPFWKELLESLSEMTVVIPIIEAATGKTLITGDYLTGDERAFKVVSEAVSLVTLGYGAAIAKGGGMALAKMFAADILAEAVSGSTVIVCDKAGVPSAVTVALAIVLGSTTGVIADKALLKNGIKIDDNVRYKKYWDDVANGKYDIPYGMTSEEYVQYLKGLDKVDKAIKGSDDVIKGGSKTISEIDRIKINNWDFTPSDEQYLKYKKVYDNPLYYNQTTGAIHWPINDGFKAGTRLDDQMISEGKIFKRYGSNSGEFLGNATDSFESRALAPHSEGAEVHYYQLTEDYKMTTGEAAAWFGSDGGAEQFVKYKADGTKYTIKELEGMGILDDVTDLVNKGEINIE